MNLYILNYNNYYNRIVKKEESFEDYQQHVIYGPVIGVYGFTPGDGVNTVQVIGSNAQMYNGEGNYLIALNSDNSINSRWFIIDNTRTRAGQFNLTLRRDVLVDFYDDIINAPAYIEKATLDLNNPLIFNSENMTVNQIKTRETLLKDKSECAWLVGYYAKNATDFNGTVPVNTNIDAEIVNYPKLEDWPIYQELTTGVKSEPLSGNYTFKVWMGNALNPACSRIKVNYKNGNTSDSYTRGPAELQALGKVYTEEQFKSYFVNFGLNNLNPLPYITTKTNTEINNMLYYDGKLIRTDDGRYYKIHIYSKQENFSVAISAGALFNNLNTILKTNMGLIGDANTSTYAFEYTSNTYSIEANEQVDIETTYNLDSAKTITTDAPWNIFAIPYGRLTINGTLGIECITNAEIAISAAMAIQQQQQSKVYDIQLLPYCPIQSLVKGGTEIFLNYLDTKDYSFIKNQQNNKTVGIIFNVPKSNFTFKLFNEEYKIPVSESSIDRKLNNECDKWRLASPNYSNYFDFSAEKNNGVQYFDVDCNYKPFTPYIHINPNFNGLYGSDFNDVRGLICGGDFSLSSIIDQWEQYQIQNKNYQLTFDRQIQNMETQHKYQRMSETVGAITGTFTGTAGGAIAGSAGGPVGAIIGGVVGGAASAIGGTADLIINEKLRNEALDYTKDLFGYQLGNIQALPQTISKVSTFNNNNKIFPVIEYYTCTNEEKIALVNKIAYNGMTVMTIGKISDYFGNSWSWQDITDKGYIKCKLIRLDISEDYHIVNAISGELNKGAYFI